MSADPKAVESLIARLEAAESGSRGMQAVRWIGVRLSIARGFVACWIYRIIPSHWEGPLGRFAWACLPYAGDYAYADDEYVQERRTYWIKHGKHMPITPIEQDPFLRALEQGGEHG